MVLTSINNLTFAEMIETLYLNKYYYILSFDVCPPQKNWKCIFKETPRWESPEEVAFFQFATTIPALSWRTCSLSALRVWVHPQKYWYQFF
jgi:hypothetical protein